MPQAQITVNAVIGSNTDLPINTLVQLANNNTGGETAYLWSIFDQPAGAADALSATNIANPTFTPKKEGTYGIQLIVNPGPTELVDRVVCAVRQLKTRIRIPAAQEQSEADAQRGWAKDGNAAQQLVDARLADPAILVGVVGASAPVLNDVCRPTGTQVIKAGLPGQETLAVYDTAPANVVTNLSGTLYVCLGGVDGNPAPIAGALAYFRVLGRVGGITDPGAVGNDVFVSDTAHLSTTAGTFHRRVGKVIAAAAGAIDVMFSGAAIGDATSDLSTDAFLMNNTDALLPSAININSIGTLLTFIPSADATTPIAVKRHSITQSAPLFYAQDQAGAAMFEIDASGNLFYVPNAGTWSVMVAGTSAMAVGTPAGGGVLTLQSNGNKWTVNTDGTISGPAGNKQVHNVADPSVAQDAATKNYVDTRGLVSTLGSLLAADQTNASTVNFADLLTQAVTITAGQILLIHATWGVSNNTNGDGVQVRVNVDGTTLGPCYAIADAANNVPHAGAHVWKVAGLGAGAHTVHLEFRARTGGTAQCRPVAAANDEGASLLVEIVTV